jgi:Cu2+-exporting ATPase
MFMPTFGLMLRPEIAALTMSGSSLLVAVNALALKGLRLPDQPRPGGLPEAIVAETTPGIPSTQQAPGR